MSDVEDQSATLTAAKVGTVGARSNNVLCQRVYKLQYHSQYTVEV